MNTRTARATRTRAAAAGAALAVSVLMLTACGGNADGETDDQSASTASGPQAWIAQSEDNEGDIVAIDGSAVTYLVMPGFEDTCPQTEQALKDIEAGSIKTDGDRDEGTYAVNSTGTIDENETQVMWDDVNGEDLTGDESGPGSISVASEMITLENVFQTGGDDIQLVKVNSPEGQKLVAAACEDS
ncbi:MAG: hypothetical protein DI630_33545 [Gordonia sp. (in: high G+C Gram-positive bacteria)]|nr:MAG: hypothetical protein DI630_33545 [Gordonia sp. (in: high G+C Gram-positive bacteria)]